MKIADLPPDEQEKVRAYNREHKKKSRAKAKAAQTPSADEASDQFPEEQTQLLREHVSDVLKQIKLELGLENFGAYQDNQNAEHAIDAVVWTLFSLKKNWIREVHSPDGLLAGGSYFPDALGAVIVESAHRYGLTKSQSFATHYRELLRILDKRFGGDETKDSRAIKAELQHQKEQEEQKQ